MSSPPQSPVLAHRRNPSNTSASAQPAIDTSRRRSYQRRSSSFAYSPIASPVQQYDGEQDVPNGAGGGLGSLADELGETWDDEEDDLNEEESHIVHDSEGFRDSGVAIGQDDGEQEQERSKSAGVSRKNGHQRIRSRHGEDDDWGESQAISKELEQQMADIENLARKGLSDKGSTDDNVVARVTERLRDLGSQTGLENSGQRLNTANGALSSHLAHQTKHLASATSTLFSPLAPPLSEDALDALIPLLESTISQIPHPPSDPLQSLAALSHSTNDILVTLSTLSDTLHMSRQTQATAQRRLRGVREQVAEFRREDDAREEGIRYIEKGQWEKRLQNREAKSVCDNVVSGFEDVCVEWRRRLEGVAA